MVGVEAAPLRVLLEQCQHIQPAKGWVLRIQGFKNAADQQKIFRLIDALEESDDVQNVYTNMDLSAEVLAALDAE